MLATFHRLTDLGNEAFQMLQTSPDDFQWWLFAANLGHHTEDVIGNGLVAGALVDRSEPRAGLRFDRGGGSSVDVELQFVSGRGLSTSVYG